MRSLIVFPVFFDESQLEHIKKRAAIDRRIAVLRASDARDVSAQVRVAITQNTRVCAGSFFVARPALGSIDDWWSPGDSRVWVLLDEFVQTRGGRVLEFSVRTTISSADTKVLQLSEPADELLSRLLPVG